MGKATFVGADGAETTLDVADGNSLMMAAIFAGLPGIEGFCGGCLSCATCHVYVDEPWLGRLAPPCDDEQRMLQEVAAERRPGSRLSCQIEMSPALDGIVVRMPDRQ